MRNARDERFRFSRRVLVTNPIASFEEAASGLIQRATAQVKRDPAGFGSGEDIMRAAGKR